MSSLFATPKPPAPPPPPPTVEDPEVMRRREAERQARLRRRGLRASILTSGLGDTGTAPVQRPSLLGQVGGIPPVRRV
jgi:hypothetical protein